MTSVVAVALSLCWSCDGAANKDPKTYARGGSGGSVRGGSGGGGSGGVDAGAGAGGADAAAGQDAGFDAAAKDAGAEDSGVNDAGAKDASVDAEIPVSTNAEQFLNDYAAAVCAMYTPCCEGEGLGFDAVGCTTSYRRVIAAAFEGMFRSAPATDCLRELARARKSDDLRCKSVLSFDAATLRSSCQLSFNITDRTGAPLGGSCQATNDCASDATDPVACVSGGCVLQKRGKSSDGPCYVRRQNEGEAKPTLFVTCETKDKLYCDVGTSQCKSMLQDGDPCPTNAGCQPSSVCSEGRCVALPGPGQACLNGVQGAGGFCRPQSTCDKNSLECGPALAQGGTCGDPNECASGSCIGGVCTKPEFTRVLNCTGKM